MSHNFETTKYCLESAKFEHKLEMGVKTCAMFNWNNIRYASSS